MNLLLAFIGIHNSPLPGVTCGISVGLGETMGGEGKAGWQPISAISLQQSFNLWQFWSQ